MRSGAEAGGERVGTAEQAGRVDDAGSEDRGFGVDDDFERCAGLTAGSVDGDGEVA